MVSDSTRVDFLSSPRLAASDAGVMRILLHESEEMNAVLGRPCVMEKQQDDQYWGFEQEQQPLSEKCTITPLDATPFPTMIFCRPQVGDHLHLSLEKFISLSLPRFLTIQLHGRLGLVRRATGWPFFYVTAEASSCTTCTLE